VHPAAGHGAGRLVSLWLGEELQFDQSIPFPKHERLGVRA
jgi:hypothetical protein